MINTEILIELEIRTEKFYEDLKRLSINMDAHVKQVIRPNKVFSNWGNYNSKRTTH